MLQVIPQFLLSLLFIIKPAFCCCSSQSLNKFRGPSLQCPKVPGSTWPVACPLGCSPGGPARGHSARGGPAWGGQPRRPSAMHNRAWQCLEVHNSGRQCLELHNSTRSAQKCTAMLGSAEQCMRGTSPGGASSTGEHPAWGIHHLSNYFNLPSKSPFPRSWTKVPLVLFVMNIRWTKIRTDRHDSRNSDLDKKFIFGKNKLIFYVKQD